MAVPKSGSERRLASPGIDDQTWDCFNFLPARSFTFVRGAESRHLEMAAPSCGPGFNFSSLSYDWGPYLFRRGDCHTARLEARDFLFVRPSINGFIERCADCGGAWQCASRSFQCHPFKPY